MKRSTTFLLATFGLTIALSTGAALAGPFGTASNHGAMSKVRAAQNNNSSSFKSFKNNGSLNQALRHTSQGGVMTAGSVSKYKTNLGSVITQTGGVTNSGAAGALSKYKGQLGGVIMQTGGIGTAGGATANGALSKYKGNLSDILHQTGGIKTAGNGQTGGPVGGTGGTGSGGTGSGGAGGTGSGGSSGSGSGGMGGGSANCKPCQPGCGWPFPIPYPVFGGCGGFGGCYGGTFPIYTGVTQTVAYEPVVGQPVVQTASAQPIDLELMEVRQLDRGTADQGPAYRVTLRNKNEGAVAQAFNVGLAASIGRQAAADAAFATARVEGLQAGQVLAVDVRLPAKATSLGTNADGQPVPFAWLTAVVDSHQEVQETARDNDLAILNRAEIAMVPQK